MAIRDILRAAAESNAELVVSGVFANRKRAHDVMRDVTTELQSLSPVPFLISH